MKTFITIIAVLAIALPAQAYSLLEWEVVSTNPPLGMNVYYRESTSQGEYTKIQLPGDARQFDLISLGLPAETQYDFYVRAITEDENGVVSESGPTNTIRYTIPKTPQIIEVPVGEQHPITSIVINIWGKVFP